ncbi:hypothetical protein [Rugamonas rubra]|uniref:Uncharacterized protein n=1 Tax=Rugamonas rubra TaxID=758825 RepID=A0A1I4SHY6_9BURK|nr:hypothetical protein [Rugamonas rubra]SFM63961.1 hypothetical protein SAMN02982985_04783 [Rugamonas rubra]
MAVSDLEAAKLAAGIIQAGLSSNAIKLYGMTGNIADPEQNATDDGVYLASVYQAVFTVIRDS